VVVCVVVRVVCLCVTCFSLTLVDVVAILQDEYAERRIEYGTIFIFSLLYDYITLNMYLYRINQAEYVIRIRVAASHAHL